MLARRVVVTIGAAVYDAAVTLESRSGMSLVLSCEQFNGARLKDGLLLKSSLLLVVHLNGCWVEIVTSTPVTIRPLSPFVGIILVISSSVPGIALSVTSPLMPDGAWYLEIAGYLCIEWAPFSGFGLALLRPDAYGESCDEALSTAASVAQRAVELLRARCAG